MRKIVLGFVALITSFLVYGDETPFEKYPTFKVDGTLKSKVEYATSIESTRFSVNSSRVGVQGYFSKYFYYRGLIELSGNGKFAPLDLYADFYPAEGLSISFGQRTIPLFNNYTIVPTQLMFSNSPFLGGYMAGARDIGLLGQYQFGLFDIPTSVEFGVYNGGNINAPAWHKRPSYGGRIALGTMQGWRATVKYYDHDSSLEENIRYDLYGADVRYESDKWKIETEMMKRRDRAQGEGDILSYYVQGAYIHQLDKDKMIKNFIPALRFDGIDQNGNSGFDVNRITLGLGFGLSEKYLSSIFRIDYEHYFVNNTPHFMSTDKTVTSNKVTVELVLVF